MKFPPMQSWLDWVVMGFFLHLGWIIFDPVVSLISGAVSAGVKASGH